MKRIGYLYSKIISVENLILADKKARKGKSKRKKIAEFDDDFENNIIAIHEDLKNKTYKTAPYRTFIVREPKERVISELPYREQIIQHAILNYLEKIFTDVFTADSYSCVKGKGIHAAHSAVGKAVKDVAGTKYCLKLDIVKFYPNINHDILKSLLRRKIKDNDLLWLLDTIIDSADGLPIGNYLSQYFANFYLTYFDHWLKEVQCVKYYYRYADDIIILSGSKTELHVILATIRKYFTKNLLLNIKSNYQVFPVAKRGINFVGYVRFHKYALLRKTIKQSFARMLKRRCTPESIASYYGWAIHCDSKNLLTKLLSDDQIFRLKYKSRRRRLRRIQAQAYRDYQPTDKSFTIRDQTFQNCRAGQATRQLSLFAN
ncbi:reverse transcriptase domain-containing protein [Flavobacterium sp. 3HN19-14]|uniref:reverse transcriptase domain-containing protein n=1 Tax=Flavobacterium sp. 3HN19-14 TaxID=3448133 RepID=UPI003EE3200E